MSAGKGDTYRKVNRWRYDEGYLRAYGIECPVCGGDGCSFCDEHGRVEKKVRDRYVREHR